MPSGRGLTGRLRPFSVPRGTFWPLPEYPITESMRILAIGGRKPESFATFSDVYSDSGMDTIYMETKKGTGL